MDLTPVQQDALTELINIGFGRAAASLSKLTGHRVQLEVPEITMCPIEQMGTYLRPLVENEGASVHQIFSGPVEGDALLVLDQSSAAILKELLTNEPALPLEIDRSGLRSAIREVGDDDCHVVATARLVRRIDQSPACRFRPRLLRQHLVDFPIVQHFRETV